MVKVVIVEKVLVLAVEHLHSLRSKNLTANLHIQLPIFGLFQVVSRGKW